MCCEFITRLCLMIGQSKRVCSSRVKLGETSASLDMECSGSPNYGVDLDNVESVEDAVRCTVILMTFATCGDESQEDDKNQRRMDHPRQCEDIPSQELTCTQFKDYSHQPPTRPNHRSHPPQTRRYTLTDRRSLRRSHQTQFQGNYSALIPEYLP